MKGEGLIFGEKTEEGTKEGQEEEELGVVEREREKKRSQRFIAKKFILFFIWFLGYVFVECKMGNHEENTAW